MTRAPHPEVEITAIAGSGRLLAGFDGSGSLRTLTAPHLDYPQHIRFSRLGLAASERAEPGRWLNGPGWKHEQEYLRGTTVLRTRSIRTGSGLELEQRAAAIDEVLLMALRLGGRQQVAAVRLVWELGLQVGGQPLANALIFEPDHRAILVYHREHGVAIGTIPLMDQLRARTGDSPGWGQNRKGIRFTTVGEVTAQLLVPIQKDGLVLLLIAAGSASAIVPALEDMLRRVPADGDWPSELADRPTGESEVIAAPPVSEPGALGPAAMECYERSTLTIAQMTDRSGALLAGPPIDQRFVRSGGYAYCWPRDGAFIANALDVCGRHGVARAFFEWALRVQPEDGIWRQRYYADGTLAPCWAAHQLDETGALLWALDQHLRLQPAPGLLRAGLEASHRAFVGMTKLAAESGWPPLTENLWEDQEGIHLYTLAALLAAVNVWFERARSLEDHVAAAVLGLAQSRLREALASWPLDSGNGAFARALLPSDGAARLHPDFTPDTSVLGLSVPFEVLEANDPRLQAAVATIERQLVTPAGRVRRYMGDRYRGGNPWPLFGLWLAWHHLRAGRREAALRLYNRVLGDRTPAGLLPEQVDARTGQARWIVPLPWAHAWFLVVTHALQGAASQTGRLGARQ